MSFSGKVERTEVSPNDCIPIKELLRQCYDQSNYIYLRKLISEDGYDSAYTLRTIWTEKMQRFDVFDGAHRLKVSQDLSLDSIPILVEDISREEALSKGYKANRTHAWLSMIDKAMQIKAVADANEKVMKLLPGKRFPGNKKEWHPKKEWLHKTAKDLKEDIKTIKNYIAIAEMPTNIRDKMGKYHVNYTVATHFIKLLNSEYAHLADEVLDKAIAEHWSEGDTEKRIGAIIHGKSMNEFKACQVCGKGYSKEQMSRLDVCPECMGHIHTLRAPRVSRGIERGIEYRDSETATEYMQRREKEKAREEFRRLE